MDKQQIINDIKEADRLYRKAWGEDWDDIDINIWLLDRLIQYARLLAVENKERTECVKGDLKMEQQEEKDFNEMAKVVESYMQKYCHPHNTIIATLDGIEVLAGVQAKPFEVLD